ncbi:GDP-mannose 4,6-dehydratase [Candidatus Micrarchaeota archaeon]|nr:GDP-mannose 4,6-dehydratase [Candidatus Micrarchaeota archaeon]
MLLVTGALGNLGRVLVPMLLSRGHFVRAVVMPGSKGKAREYFASHKHLTPAMRKQIQFWELDLSVESAKNKEMMKKACFLCDTVIHLAGLVDYSVSKKKLLEANYFTTKNLLEAARMARVKKFIYASSTSVYRQPKFLPINEKHPFTPTNDYGKTKMLAEHAIQTSGVPYIILRLSALYGPTFLHAYSQLFEKIFSGKQRIIGEGYNRVTFLHANDAARAFLAALKSDRLNQSYIICSEEKLTQKLCLQTVAESLGVNPPQKTISVKTAHFLAGLSSWKAKMTGKPPKITFEAIDTMSQDRYFTSRKARSRLKWKPLIKFSNGARQLAAIWLRHYKSRPQQLQEKPAGGAQPVVEKNP